MTSTLRAFASFALLSTLIATSFSTKAVAYINESETSVVPLSAYRPVYFVIGATHSKLEFSFKAKIVDSVPIFIGYTQTSFWDIFANSAPFFDTTYAPDLFYRHNFTKTRHLDLGGSHESNGKDGDASRAWNRPFVRLSDTDTTGPSKLTWDAQAWVPIPSQDKSKDLAKYRGIFELNLAWHDFLGPDFDQDDLILRFYPGGSFYLNPFLGGQELTLRLKSASRKFLPLFVIQFFHGYGESLLSADQNVTVLRGGLGF